MNINKKVLALDLEHLSQEDLDWPHKLKTLAMAMQGRIYLKHLKEEAA